MRVAAASLVAVALIFCIIGLILGIPVSCLQGATSSIAAVGRRRVDKQIVPEMSPRGFANRLAAPDVEAGARVLGSPESIVSGDRVVIKIDSIARCQHE